MLSKRSRLLSFCSPDGRSVLRSAGPHFAEERKVEKINGAPGCANELPKAYSVWAEDTAPFSFTYSARRGGITTLLPGGKR